MLKVILYYAIFFFFFWKWIFIWQNTKKNKQQKNGENCTVFQIENFSLLELTNEWTKIIKHDESFTLYYMDAR